MSATRGRVIRRGSDLNAQVVPLAAETQASLAKSRIIPRRVAEAQVEADALIRQAKALARQIEARARSVADDLTLTQQARARADALSLVVAEAVALRRHKAQLADQLQERSVAMARILAERLLGEELRLAPARIAAIARETLREAAGARQAVLAANPRDAIHLRAELANMDTLLESVQIAEDENLPPGTLRVDTELGVIEADVGRQLDRLTAQLRKLVAETPVSAASGAVDDGDPNRSGKASPG